MDNHGDPDLKEPKNPSNIVTIIILGLFLAGIITYGIFYLAEKLILETFISKEVTSSQPSNNFEKKVKDILLDQTDTNRLNSESYLERLKMENQTLKKTLSELNKKIEEKEKLTPTGWQKYFNNYLKLEYSYPEKYHVNLSGVFVDLSYPKSKDNVRIKVFETTKQTYDSNTTWDKNLLASCTAEGLLGSSSCDRIVKQEKITNSNGVVFDKLYLNLVFLDSQKKEKTEEIIGPYFIHHYPHNKNTYIEFSIARSINENLKNITSSENLNLDQSLEKIIDTVKIRY